MINQDFLFENKYMGYGYNTNNIKHKGLYGWYLSQPEPKPRWSVFCARVTRYKFPLQKAILLNSFKGIHLIKGHIDKKGRVCNCCSKYKKREFYSRTKFTKTGYTGECLDCRNLKKKEYRKKTKSSKDMEYKKKKRTLEVGSKIAFYETINHEGIEREDSYIVIRYKFKKGYLLKSEINGKFTWLDTCDNYNVNKNCRKFYIIK